MDEWREILSRVNIYWFNDLKLFNDLVLGIIELFKNGNYGLLLFMGWRSFDCLTQRFFDT